MKYSEGLWPGQIPTKPKYLAVIFVSLFLTFGCASFGEKSEDLDNFCESQEVTFECRLAGAIKTNTKFVRQIAHAVDIRAIDPDVAERALDLSESAETATKLASQSGDPLDLRNAESLLLALEQILIAQGVE